MDSGKAKWATPTARRATTAGQRGSGALRLADLVDNVPDLLMRHRIAIEKTLLSVAKAYQR
jgi:hypothetical protein